MSNVHPVLGYPSKSDAAWALQRRGLSHRQIAAEIGVNPSAVGNLIRHARTVRRHASSQIYTDRLTAAQRARLRAEAQKRGQTVRQLVNALLSAVADDRLFAALLDDGGDN